MLLAFRKSTTLIGVGAAVALLLGTAACGGGDAEAADGKVGVVAAFYPLQFLAERVGADRVHVTNLVKPGAEPHDLELTPKQLTQVYDADLVVYLRGFQPAVDEGVDAEAADSSFDAATVGPLRTSPAGEESENGEDPHVWLDPDRFAAIADRLADRLATVEPANAGAFAQRATALRAELTALDREFAAGLATCRRRQIVTSHAAFGYLAARYGLTQTPISGLSPEGEPSPRRLTEIAAQVERDGITTIFFESLVSPKIAETLAKEVGARAEVLDPIEGIEDGGPGDYFSVMRDNLGRLKIALGCT